jgi:thiosulfate reductase cytochrome b subunit
MDRVRAGRAFLVSLPIMIVVMLVVGATPAFAAGGPAPVLAEAKPWHFWGSFVLIASVVGLFFMLLVGYLVKVTAPKYGIKIGRKSAG